VELTVSIQTIIGVLGGLGLFLLGMKNMSEGMQVVAGQKLRVMINKITDNRFVACSIGAGITSLIQSSSVTTVMVVGMVNAGLMTLRQSIGVILGADIGTTITAWIISLKIADYGLPIMAISLLFYLFSKNDRFQFTSMIVVGLGMIFFGLEIIKESLNILRDSSEVSALFSRFEPDSYLGVIKCVFIGALVTAILQSSSATVAITITLAQTGAIGYDTAVALVLGENIGTTITAFLASLGASTTAKRTAFAHITIKIIGVTLMIPLFFYYMTFLKWLLPEQAPIAARIAFSHTGFNIIIVSLFLPSIGLLVKFIQYIVPKNKYKEKLHLTYFDIGMYEIPTIGIQQSYQAINKMASDVKDMMALLHKSLKEEDELKARDNKLFDKEKQLDLLQKEIVQFIGKMLTGNLVQSTITEARKQIRLADEYESISDYIENLLKLRCRLRNNGLSFNESDLKDLLDLHDTVSDYLDKIKIAVHSNNSDIITKAKTYGNSISARIKHIRSNHLNRLEKNETMPLQSLNFLDMLNAYRRIKDHALNIAEVLAGEK
jgi:phosphate:Na+ symporter